MMQWIRVVSKLHYAVLCALVNVHPLANETIPNTITIVEFRTYQADIKLSSSQILSHLSLPNTILHLPYKVGGDAIPLHFFAH